MDEKIIYKHNVTLKEKLQSAIDIERISAKCCCHLSSLIKNGKIRSKFFVMSEVAKVNEALLCDYLRQLGITHFISEERCKYCKINPESFSLLGAINLGLEITEAAITHYKDLVTLVACSEDKKIFKKLLKEKDEQRDFLKKERKFVHEKEDKNQFDCIMNYCIPKVISKI